MENPQEQKKKSFVEEEDDRDQDLHRDRFKRERDDQGKKSEDEKESLKQSLQEEKSIHVDNKTQVTSGTREFELERGRERNTSRDRSRGRSISDSRSPETHKSRSISRSESRERERSRERNRSRERYRDYYRSNRESPSRDRYTRNRERSRSLSPSERRSRDSPPIKRRRRDSWDERERSPERDYRYPSYDRNRNRKRRNFDEYEPRRRQKNFRSNGSLKTYKQYMESQDEELNPEEGQQKYQEYKEEFKRKQCRLFFEDHKNEEWFKEKYDPTYLEKSRMEKLENAKENFKLFMEELNSGKLDFNLSSDSLEIEVGIIDTEVKTSTIESNVDSTQHEKENISEEKEEKEEKEENNTGKEAENMEEEQESDQNKSSNMNIDPTTLFIKSIPPIIGKADLKELFKSVPGFSSLSLSEPNKTKNFQRLGWVTFDSKEACSKALQDFNGHKIKDFEIQLAINKPPSDFQKKYKMAPPVASEESRISIDCLQSEKLAKQLDKEKEIENSLFNDEFHSLPPVEQLDKTLTYLRRVHFFCYYCGEEFDSEEELHRKCSKKHLRGKKIEESSVDATTDTWAQNLDTKIKNRIENPDNPDIRTGKTEIEKYPFLLFIYLFP